MKTTVQYILLSLLLFGCTASAQINENALQRQLAERSPDPLVGTALKTTRDIEQRVAQLHKNGSSETLAQAIAEIDEWLFAPEEEKRADQMLESLLGELRNQIEKEVAALSRAALDSPSGKVATDKLSKINSLLILYPMPKTDEQLAKLNEISSSIRSTFRRVEDIRRLRYNTWAISRIESGLSDYYKIKGVISTDEDALIKTSIDSMKTIDPASLEPAALDLYNYVIGLTRNTVSNKSRVALAKGFADPRTQRKTPIDF